MTPPIDRLRLAADLLDVAARAVPVVVAVDLGYELREAGRMAQAARDLAVSLGLPTRWQQYHAAAPGCSRTPSELAAALDRFDAAMQPLHAAIERHSAQQGTWPARHGTSIR
ncbi:MAG: hypothetical protein KF863_10365 [Rubrivivax sp.]|nr:hypothetical protein [Rubrivivax sp.]